MQLFLAVLRILGILVLALILAAAVILLAVLLCPVRYRAEVQREGTDAPEGSARVYWLLHALSLRVDYRENLTWNLRVLGVRAAGTSPGGKRKAGKEEKTPEQIPGKKRRTEPDKNETDTPSGPGNPEKDSLDRDSPDKGSSDKDNPDRDSLNKDSPGKDSPNRDSLNSDNPDKDAPAQEKAGEENGEPEGNETDSPGRGGERFSEKLAGLWERFAGFLERLADGEEKLGEWIDGLPEQIGRLRDKAERILGQIRDAQNRSAVRMIFGTAGALLAHIRPRRLEITGRLGLKDPAATGKVFGVLGMLMPLYGDTIRLEAVFDREVIEGNLRTKGRVRLGTVLGRAVGLICRREVRRLIRGLRAEKAAAA